jgi:cytidylate kinase
MRRRPGGAAAASGEPAAGRLRPVIAIDGPAGAGKSTIARAVAERLGFVYLDSGALYRGVAWGLGEAAGDQADLEQRLGGLELAGRPGAGGFMVFVRGRDVTGALRAPAIGEAASALAVDPLVRRYVGERLRRIAATHACVAEGRDMGTVVFPDAALKIFLTASLAERARRRCAQLAAQGQTADPDAVRAAIAARDARDSTRAASPLRAAADAVRIDNTRLSPEAQVSLIVEFFHGGGHLRGSLFYRSVQGLARLLFRLLLGLRVAGGEALPRGAFLIASNHRSYLDPPLYGAVAPMPIAYLAKESLFRIPIFGGLIRALGAIPIRREGSDPRGLRGALAVLEGGRPLVVFPEGTRGRRGRLGKPRAGIALLARRAGVPVVPAYLAGSDRPLAALLRRPPLRLRIGPPMPPPDPDDPGGDQAYARQVMAAIAGLAPGSGAEEAC